MSGQLFHLNKDQGAAHTRLAEIQSTTILHTSDGLTNRSAWDVASCVFLKNKLQTPISGWEPQWLLSAGWHTPPPSGFQLHKLGHDDHDDDHDGGDDDHDNDDYEGDELHKLCHLFSQTHKWGRKIIH